MADRIVAIRIYIKTIFACFILFISSHLSTTKHWGIRKILSVWNILMNALKLFLSGAIRKQLDQDLILNTGYFRKGCP